MLTDLELKLMNWVAFNEMTPLNGQTPEKASDCSCYYWADEIAFALSVNEKAVGGVSTSLQNKGFVTIDLDDEDSYIDFTEEGFAAWKAAQ